MPACFSGVAGGGRVEEVVGYAGFAGMEVDCSEVGRDEGEGCIYGPEGRGELVRDQ